jgi:hypothetical protein
MSLADNQLQGWAEVVSWIFSRIANTSDILGILSFLKIGPSDLPHIYTAIAPVVLPPVFLSALLFLLLWRRQRVSGDGSRTLADGNGNQDEDQKLKRDERHYRIAKNQKDVEYVRTLVILGKNPPNSVGVELDVPADEDFERVFVRIRNGCRGGRAGSYKLASEVSKARRVMAIDIRPDTPQTHGEITISFQVRLKNYFSSGHFREFIKALVPTETLIVRISPPAGRRLVNQRTMLTEASAETNLGNKHYSELVANGLKWELSPAEPSSLYRLDVDIA